MLKTFSHWGSGALWACSLISISSNAAAQAGFTPITFKNASVHDPSIVRAGNTYYVFGPHLASAKTQDLMNWEQLTSSVSATNPLFLNGARNVYHRLVDQPAAERAPAACSRWA